MTDERRVCHGVWKVGGPELSDDRDCLVYALDLGELVLIDCGCGSGWPRICSNLTACGFDAAGIRTLVLTHCHVDHIGAAGLVKAGSVSCRVVAHALDREAIESGDQERTAASWYRVRLTGTPVDQAVSGSEDAIVFPAGTLRLLHTPGHTPGSMVALVDTPDGRVLFGQDIHGPFSKSFGSDVEAWNRSMARLLDLNADILCEGHYGVFRGRSAVREFIEEQLDLNG